MIEHNAEIKVLKDLKALAEKNPAHRCLYMRFSQTNIPKEKWLPVLTQILRARFFEEVSQIYICHDHDVFITGRSWSNKRSKEFLHIMSVKLSQSSLIDIASLHEVGFNWPRLKSLCEAKLENLKIIEENNKRNKHIEIDFVTRINALETIDSELIQNLNARRHNRKSIEIMIVEDDAFSQKLIASTLKSYSTTMTSDGQGAIMTYVNKAPDVLFLDIGLPDIDGHEVLEKIFKIDPKAYVVMFSGNGDRENIMKAIQTGAKGFIGKPFTKEKIFQYLEKSPFIQLKQTKKEHV
jgi:two-component system, chemotaxis family, chemotaxis protein CheY